MEEIARAHLKASLGSYFDSTHESATGTAMRKACEANRKVSTKSQRQERTWAAPGPGLARTQLEQWEEMQLGKMQVLDHMQLDGQ